VACGESRINLFESKSRLKPPLPINNEVDVSDLGMTNP
jgi:hypothetical protein